MYIALRSEFIKTKRTTTIYLTLIISILLPFIMLSELNEDAYRIKIFSSNPWNIIYRNAATALNMVILPLFIILLSTMLAQVEYRNNTWKQLLASPQSPIQSFGSKFLQLQIIILIFLLLHNLLMAIVPLIVALDYPNLDFYNHPFKWKTWLLENIITYIGFLGFSAVQFWLSLRFRTFIKPIAIGIGLWLLGMMLVFEFKWEQAYLYPYSIPVLNGSKISDSGLLTSPGRNDLCSLANGFVFLLLVMFDYSNRRIR